jgi:hypothetical protein
MLTWQCQLIFYLFNSLQNFYLSFLLGVNSYLILVFYHFFKKFPLFLEVKNLVNGLFIFIKIVIPSAHHKKKKLTEFLQELFYTCITHPLLITLFSLKKMIFIKKLSMMTSETTF